MEKTTMADEARWAFGETGKPTACAICGCQEHDPCPDGCGWFEGLDICTACVELADTVAEHLERLTVDEAADATDYARGLGGFTTLVRLALQHQRGGQFQRWTLTPDGFLWQRMTRHGHGGELVRLQGLSGGTELSLHTLRVLAPRGSVVVDIEIDGHSQMLCPGEGVPVEHLERGLCGIVPGIVAPDTPVRVLVQVGDTGGRCAADWQWVPLGADQMISQGLIPGPAPTPRAPSRLKPLHSRPRRNVRELQMVRRRCPQCNAELEHTDRCSSCTWAVV